MVPNIMNLQDTLAKLKQEFDIIAEIDLGICLDQSLQWARDYITEVCKVARREEYENKQRLVFVLPGDFYDETGVGALLYTLQEKLNEIDISNFFVIVVTSNADIENELSKLSQISSDPVGIKSQIYLDQYQSLELTDRDRVRLHEYRYGSPEPVKISLSQLQDRERFLLSESKHFCMYPWIHMHAYPDGRVFPCCHAEHSVDNFGSCKSHTLGEIWNQPPMRELRLNMLEDRPSAACQRCYEQDESGFFSGRKSANKHHGHHISKIFDTGSDGTVDDFAMTYWDIRFSNLCNLRCRSCGHLFSSNWFSDQVKLAGPEYKLRNQPLNYAGRWETDVWEQLIEHIDHVEQIYFAGGEPLLMQEHYNILEELERRERFDVRLIYNTNFTEVRLKDRLVFDYWKKFDSVSVGASLDAQGDRAHYIRRGTDWAQVEQNRRDMLAICPKVDFYVSATLSIMNAWHLPDFHRDWTERGLIRAQDFNVNILQDPRHYRIDIAPPAVKHQLQEIYHEHLDWLKPQDPLQRATVGFNSAMKYMMSQDNTGLLPEFWRRTRELDDIRNENVLDVLPELQALL